MSDTTWISLAVIVGTVGIVVIVVLLRKQKDAYLHLSTKWGGFTFSPGDAKCIINEFIGGLDKKDVEVLEKFNTPTGKPDPDVLAKLDPEILKKLICLKLVQDPANPDLPSSNQALKLAYVGWQVLESYTGKRPNADPWKWPKIQG